jgi:hypothetical protein
MGGVDPRVPTGVEAGHQGARLHVKTVAGRGPAWNASAVPQVGILQVPHQVSAEGRVDGLATQTDAQDGHAELQAAPEEGEFKGRPVGVGIALPGTGFRIGSVEGGGNVVASRE